jgi:hypothetical protein
MIAPAVIQLAIRAAAIVAVVGIACFTACWYNGGR